MSGENPTNPDSLDALAKDIRFIRNELTERVVKAEAKVAELSLAVQELSEMKGRVIRMDSVLGRPEQVVPGMFEGDPSKIIPAEGVCLTLDRLSKADARRMRKSVWTAGGIAAAIALVGEALKAWNNAAPPPKHEPPPAVMVGQALDGMRK